MRALSVAVLALVTSVAGVAGQAGLQPAQMQQDFDVLRRALEEAHGGLHRYSTKAELDKQFDNARAALDRPMSTLAFAGVLSEALAAVRDGHMQLEYDVETSSALSRARLLPLRVALEAGHLVVIGNDTPANTAIRPGMELLSVNGRAAADIVKTILPKLSGDGFIETGRLSRLARGFARNYWLYVEQTGTFVVTARATDGATVTATLDGVTNAERNASANPVNDDAVSVSFPNGGDVAVLRVRTFGSDDFLSSLATAFATVRERKSRAVILDLRGNGGGVDTYGAALVSYFVSAPFRYFDHIKVTTIRPSFATWNAATYERLKAGTQPAPDGGFLVLPQLHPGVAEQQPATAPFLGQVIVLIDGGTFSTSADVCAQLRSRTRATFIGEETGGAFEGNSSGLNADVMLPNSKLKLRIMMYGYWNAVTGGQRGRGTMPDVTVIRKIVDTLAGVDVGMEKAMAMTRR